MMAQEAAYPEGLTGPERRALERYYKMEQEAIEQYKVADRWTVEGRRVMVMSSQLRYEASDRREAIKRRARARHQGQGGYAMVEMGRTNKEAEDDAVVAEIEAAAVAAAVPVLRLGSMGSMFDGELQVGKIEKGIAGWWWTSVASWNRPRVMIRAATLEEVRKAGERAWAKMKEEMGEEWS